MDRYALWTTPLNLILGDNINLRDNTDIIGVDQQSNQLIIQARAHDGQANGTITLYFPNPILRSGNGLCVDAQGLSTTVTVNNVKKGCRHRSRFVRDHESVNAARNP